MPVYKVTGLALVIPSTSIMVSSSLLGSNNVNIASMQVGRKIVRGEAVMVLSIDDPIPNKLLDTIIEVEGITNANPVTL